MTILDLSKIIRELISSSEESIQLPGFGSFIVIDTPSELINDDKAITPPSRKIVFDSSFDNNNTLLAGKYAKMKGVSLVSAKNEVATFLSGLKRELVECTELVIPQFGTICFGEKGSFVFQPEPAFDFEADSYCLEIIPLKVRGTAEPSAQPSEDEKFELEEIDIELADETADDDVAETAETEEAVAADVAEPADVSEPAAVAEVAAAEQVQTAVAVPEAAAVPKKNWVLWGVLTAVGIIILLAVLLFVFKDNLRPVLEQLLYSKEELEILHKAGF